MPYILVESFMLGIIYGFGPCTLSCAPILVPIVMSTSKGMRQGLFQTLLFSLGRIIVYIILGAIMGAIGKSFNLYLPNWLIGILLALLGVSLILDVQKKCFIKNIRLTGSHMAFVAGIIMGISPCAPLLAALALAVSSKSSILGATVALVFGIGTLLSPILLIGLVSGKWASIKEFGQINRYIAGSFLIVIGTLFFFQ
ncbi:MAG: sulfite exporter TauE/SafE family protein [Candidatus Woesearchaeota archaeon]